MSRQGFDAGSPSTRPAPLHVGKVIPPPYAGIEAHIDTLLRSLSGHVDATLVATRGRNLTTSRDDSPVPYRVMPVSAMGKLASVQLSPGILTTVRGELNAGRANLLHLHAPNPWGDLAAMTARKDLPVVMTWHSDIVRQKRLMLLYGRMQRRVLDRVDRVIVFTPKHYESSSQLRQAGITHKITSIPLGLDFDRLHHHLPDLALLDEIGRWQAGRPLILTVGRHIYYKGYAHLLDAMAALDSDAVLAMVGTGPLSDELQAQAQALGLAERVRMLGEVDNRALVSLFHHCDLFTLPSIEPSEAFGIATAEAMACGKPTVVCELGNGVNYLTRHGETGLAVTPRDSAALARALDELIRDDALRSKMGNAAQQWVRSEFSMDKMRDSTLALYRSLL